VEERNLRAFSRRATNLSPHSHVVDEADFRCEERKKSEGIRRPETIVLSVNAN
jgi:hypothetical protein